MKSMGRITVCCIGLVATSVAAETGYPPPTGPYNPDQMAPPQEGMTYNWAPTNNDVQPAQSSQPLPQTPQPAGQPAASYPIYQDPQYGNNTYAPVPGNRGGSPVNPTGESMPDMLPMNREYTTPDYSPNPWTAQRYTGGYNYPTHPPATTYGYDYPQPYDNYPAQRGWEFVPEYPTYQGYGYQAPSGYNPAYGYPAPSQGTGYYQGYGPYGTASQPPQATYPAPVYDNYPTEQIQQNPAYYPPSGFSAPAAGGYTPEVVAPQVSAPQPAMTEPPQPLPAAPAMPPIPQQQSVMVNGEPARFRPLTEQSTPISEGDPGQAGQ